LRQEKGYASISNTDISNLMLHSENTLANSIIYKPKIGDAIKNSKGAFKNNLAQEIGLEGKDRIELMLNFLSIEIIIYFDLKDITQIQ